MRFPGFWEILKPGLKDLKILNLKGGGLILSPRHTFAVERDARIGDNEADTACNNQRFLGGVYLKQTLVNAVGPVVEPLLGHFGI